MNDWLLLFIFKFDIWSVSIKESMFSLSLFLFSSFYKEQDISYDIKFGMMLVPNEFNCENKPDLVAILFFK